MRHKPVTRVNFVATQACLQRRGPRALTVTSPFHVPATVSAPSSWHTYLGFENNNSVGGSARAAAHVRMEHAPTSKIQISIFTATCEAVPRRHQHQILVRIPVPRYY